MRFRKRAVDSSGSHFLLFFPIDIESFLDGDKFFITLTRAIYFL